MKKFLLILAIISCHIFSAQGNDQKSIIQQDAWSFLTLLKAKEYDKILEMTYPALFEKVDKELLTSSFKMIFEGNEDFSIELLDADKSTFSVSEIFQENDFKYAFVIHPTSMKMTFLKQKFNEEEKKMMANMMEVQGMDIKFIDDNSLEMLKESMMIAMNDKSTGHKWKYLNYDDSNPMFVAVVPVSVIKKAKNYYADFLIKRKENAN